MPTAVNSINSRLYAVDFVYLYIPLHEKSFYVARINADLLIFPWKLWTVQFSNGLGTSEEPYRSEIELNINLLW